MPINYDVEYPKLLRQKQELETQLAELRRVAIKEAAFVLRERFAVEDEHCDERLRQSANRLADAAKATWPNTKEEE